MGDRIQPLAGERQSRETSRAVQACNDWLRLGAGRTTVALFEKYKESEEKSTPTRSIGTLNNWSARYGWANRAELYDAEVEAERDAVARAYASEITEEGLALIHERVKTLKALAGRLLEDMEEVDKVWLKDVKQIGSGDMAERVDLIRFNAPLFQQLRGVLEDIAKEMGHRAQKFDVDHSGAISLTYTGNTDPEAM